MTGSYPRGSRRPLLTTPLGVASALCLGVLLSSIGLTAQQIEIVIVEPGQVQELVLTDGSTLMGRVVDTGDPFRFVLLSGSESQISVANVRSLRVVEGEVEGGEFWPDDPNQTRLFFGPTARSIPAREGYLAVYELIFPFLAVGITDSLLLSGGTWLLFGAGESQPYWIAPKLRVFHGERTDVAIGALAVGVEDESAGMLYGVVTTGGQRRTVSVGLGYGYANGDLAESPAVMLGGNVRVSRRISLITENYLVPEWSGALISFGPRFIGERLSADLGLAIPIGDGDSYTFPLVNFVWNF